MHEILAIDDHPPTLKLLQNLLGEEGYTLRLATNGLMALTSLRLRRPDLILLDLSMPKMDGYEVCRRIKADDLTKDIPVIVVSGIQDTCDKVRAFSIGAVDVVTKPFQAEELKARIRTHLTLKSLQEELQQFNRELGVLVQERTAQLASIYQAAQAISSEINREDLLKTMMQVIFKNVDAQQGVLLLEHDQVLAIVAEGNAETFTVLAQPFVDLDDHIKIPMSIVSAVKTMGQSVMVDGTTCDEPYASDRYIQKYLPKSILCIPIMKHGRFMGCVYFENTTVHGAFTPACLNLLEILAAQAAISLDNARLYEDIQHSLSEKEVLLKEVHHRVKNNLQVISSLLRLQRDQVTEVGTRDVLDQTQDRVFAMAAVHEHLYSGQNLKSVSMMHYLQSLAAHLLRVYGLDSKFITLRVEPTTVLLDIDKAAPCGLIVTELVSNCFKHAFSSGATGEIVIRLEEEKDHQYGLQVSDTGKGFPDGVDWRTVDSLGLQLVKTLVEHQLGGRIVLVHDQGSTFSATFGSHRKTHREEAQDCLLSRP